jgi:ElaB/YqjD/DUF883 family membrane-anchored ribosome-binding protein
VVRGPLPTAAADLRENNSATRNGRATRRILMNAALDTSAAGNGVLPVNAAVGLQFAELFDGVDDLIHRVAQAECPEIRRARAKVYASMVVAKNAFEDDANKATVAGARIADGVEDSLADYPGQGLGVALLVALGLGLISSLRQEG